MNFCRLMCLLTSFALTGCAANKPYSSSSDTGCEHTGKPGESKGGGACAF